MKKTIALSTLFFLGSCGGEGTPTTPPSTPTPTPVATSNTLSATTLSFASLGQTQPLSATVKDQNGATMSGATVTWTSSNNGVATVSASGVVTSVADGSAPIRATSGSATATASVTVTSAPTWESVSAGGESTCGMNSTGNAYCWGRDSHGNLGTAGGGSTSTPALVTGGHTWAKITVGATHTCGVTTAGVA